MRTIGLFVALLLAGVGLTACEPEVPAETFASRLTGEIRFGAWSEKAAGLECRLGSSDAGFVIGGPGPVLVLQVRNASESPILAPDLFLPSMIVSGCPTDAVYHGSDFQWVFDDARRRRPLLPGESVEAACRIPTKLLRSADACDLKVSVERGLRMPDTAGYPVRGGDWWTGSMTTPPLALQGRKRRGS